MLRRPPRSTLDRSSAASDVYKRQRPQRDDRRIEVLIECGPLEAIRIDRRRIIVVVDPHILVAVSYTHLRAHETVLDLVCRLLLEKKKK